MTSRPYFNKSIFELEALFDDKNQDQSILSELKQELAHRHVKRAGNLAAKIDEALSKNPTLTSPRPKSENLAPPAPERKSLQDAVVSPVKLEVKPVCNIEEEEREVKLPPPPPVSNQSANILSAWTALEVLSPPSFRKPEDLAGGPRSLIAPFRDSRLPWENGGERSKPNQRLYYQIVLGTIDLEAAVSALLKVYTDRRPERPATRGEAILATVLVDQTGRPVESDPIAL
jgi:hypothetical protein